MPTQFVRLVKKTRLLPIMTGSDPDRVIKLVDDFAQAGQGVVAIALRDDRDLATINRICAESQMLVGAGLVFNAQQCQQAVNAGARFIMSPGLDRDIVRYCRNRKVCCLPGISSATDLQRAYNLGVRAVHFFPAQACGGTKMLRALAEVFSEVKFVPSGGIDKETLSNYVTIEAVLAAGVGFGDEQAFDRDAVAGLLNRARREAEMLAVRQGAPQS
jgi:2-dehydro-3-deoxyphosphogluconate aldolase/(4S)-4-hydroxy-2-oxoglutarate aldolase